MSRTPFGVHLPRARSEDEPERVGAERDREERVVLVRDAADLDEHQSGSVVRPAAAASSRTSADGIVGPYERFTDEHGVESGAGHARGVGGAAHRALGHRDHIRREPGRERLADTEILGERREVAAVDADDACAGGERAVDSRSSCASTSTPMPELGRRARGDRRARRRPGSRPRSAGSRRHRSRAPRTPGPRRW